MSKKQIYRITSISEDDAYYNNRKQLIGKEFIYIDVDFQLVKFIKPVSINERHITMAKFYSFTCEKVND
jgi:hypothetical protein